MYPKIKVWRVCWALLGVLMMFVTAKVFPDSAEIGLFWAVFASLAFLPDKEALDFFDKQQEEEDRENGRR